MAAILVHYRVGIPLLLVAISVWAMSSPAAHAAREIVLVKPNAADNVGCAAWRKEGFTAVALIVDEQSDAAILGTAARAAAAHSLDVYVWIEVGRCPELARAHPEWMAALGSHDDWH